MNKSRKFWQQAAGDRNRNYADICLRWDVILNGPGDVGAWPDSVTELKKDNWSSRKITDLRRFAETMGDGDIVVLRLGTAEVLGVGIVVGQYQWSELFEDIDGWDLQHVRRVKWLWKGIKNPKEFKTYTLKQGDTTQELTSEPVKNWIQKLELNFNDTPEPVTLPTLPNEKVNEVEFEQISEALFDQGVSNRLIDALSKEIDELIDVAKWYKRSETPSESETVAYLVMPLLRALGWTPQKMAIEWNNVDIALFRTLPRNDEHLNVVVEAKKKDDACLTAFPQAASYANGKHNCKRLIVTDGLRYGVYIGENENFNLYAYFNLTKLRNTCPIYDCCGAIEGLIAMTPEWSP